MPEPDTSEVVAEALKFRLALERCKEEGIPLVTEDFPVMNCKMSSLLFTYHALKKWPSITIYGVGGIATDHNENSAISHYWLEHRETAIDLTADQYNIIKDKHLNSAIIKCRPFEPVSIGHIGSMLNYKLFKVSYRDTYVHGMPELAEDFLQGLHASYGALERLALCT